MIEDLTNKKVLIFSDTHLTCKFNQKHFEALKGQILKADKVILNGDFWEYIGCHFDKFVKSEWAEKLFPLLKERDTFYIHGNHDRERFMSWENISKIAVDREKDYKFKSGDKIFKVEHGDLISWEFDDYHRHISEFFHRFLPTFYLWLMEFEYKKNFLARLWHKVMVEKRRRDFEKIEKFAKKNQRENYIRIFGHVHRRKHNLKYNFLILGEFKSGKINCIFVENGEIEFVSGEY